MRKHNYLIIVLCFFLTGCASTLRKSSHYENTIYNIKTIAVMPPDIEVYKVTAGGMTELIDEWSQLAQELTEKALKEELAKYGFNIVMINKQWLKENHRELWEANRSLYNAVGLSAIRHAYPGPETFSDKAENFDYSLGSEVKELAKVCGADALLFITGVDHEATAGRTAMLIWNMVLGAAVGVTVIPGAEPSFMVLGLIETDSGDIDWFNTTPPDMQYTFRSEQHIKSIVQWLTKNFLPKEKK